jgi:hypothetical protein
LHHTTHLFDGALVDTGRLTVLCFRHATSIIVASCSISAAV